MAKKKKPAPDESDAENRRVGMILALRPDELDRRTAAYRQYAAIRDAVIVDCGGEDAISEARRQLIDRFACISLWCASMDARAFSGDEIDVDLYGRISGHLRRLADGIGLSRVAREVKPLRERLREGGSNA